MGFWGALVTILALLVLCDCDEDQRQLCSFSKNDGKCYCTYRPSELPSRLPELTADCSRLEIGKFPSNKQFPDDLGVLDLSHNNLKELDDFSSSFTSYTLRQLSLAYNEINFISDEFLRYIPSLELLDLSHNELTSFENPDVLYGLENLTVLDLSFNRLQALPEKFFDTVPRLRWLNLGYNELGDFLTRITNLGNSSLSISMNLVGLKMDNLNISDLHNGFFDSFHTLKFLSLADNPFSEVPVVPYSVEYLDLSGSYITTLAARNLNYHQLKTLKLNRLPRLTTIDHYAFYNLDSLEELSLNDCGQLTEFTDLAFGVLYKDVELRLKKLSVAGSGLQTLNYSFGHLFDELDYINIGNNPWKCDCNLMWLRDYNRSLYRSENIRCAKPGLLRYRQLMQLTPRQLPRCKTQQYGTLHKAMLPILAILISVLIALIIYLIYMAPAIYGNRFRVGPQSPYQGVTVQVEES